MTALALTLPDEATLLDAYEHARRHGLELVTDGRELVYTPAHHIPPGYTRFAVHVRPAPVDPKAPRA